MLFVLDYMTVDETDTEGTAKVIIQDPETQEIYTDGNGFVDVRLKEGESKSLLLSLDQQATEAVLVTIHTPPRTVNLSDDTLVIPNCLVWLEGQEPGSFATTNLTGTNQVQLNYAAAIDPVVSEINICLIQIDRVGRTGNSKLILSIIVDIVENTGNQVTVVDSEEPPFVQSEHSIGSGLYIVFPQPLDTTGTIRFTYVQPQFCRLLNPIQDDLVAIENGHLATLAVTSSINNFYGPFSVEAFGVIQDEVCSIEIDFIETPSGYEGVEIAQIQIEITDEVVAPIFDIYADGRVTPTDAIHALNRIGDEITVENSRLDIDGDGEIDADDVEIIIELLGSSDE